MPEIAGGVAWDPVATYPLWSVGEVWEVLEQGREGAAFGASRRLDFNMKEV